jgi:predicted Zn-ribbon and HTH transcriptional regulator
MPRKMSCDSCGHVEGYDNIATAPSYCPRCGEPWGPQY